MSLADFHKNPLPERDEDYLPEADVGVWVKLKKRLKQWRGMFADRLKREDRWQQFRLACLKKCELEEIAWRPAFDALAPEFGFISLQDEQEVLKDWLFQDAQGFAAKILERRRIERVREAKRKTKEIAALAAVEDAAIQRLNHKRSSLVSKVSNQIESTDDDLPPDVSWVYNHPLLLATLDGSRPKDTSVLPADLAGAPSRGAVTMLYFARDNMENFMRRVIETQMAVARKVKQPVAKPAEEVDEPDTSGTTDVSAMLASLASKKS